MTATDPWRSAGDRIASVEVTGGRRPAAALNARRWGADEHVTLVTATTESGLRATTAGRAHGGMPADVIGAQVQWCAATLIGRPLAAHRAVLAEWSAAVSRQYVATFAPALLDVVLWDLRARSLQTSVAALLDPDPLSAVETYASLPIGTDPAVVAESARSAVVGGAVGVKVHTCGDVVADLAVLAAAAGAVAGSAFLAYDAAGGLSRDDAARIGTALDGWGARWFEEPFGPWDVESFRWLRDRCAVPLAGFETAPGGPGALRLVAASGGPHLIAVDCYWKGGITGVVDAVATARAAGLGVVMHHGSTAELDAANVHVAAALRLAPVEAMPDADGAAAGSARRLLRPGIGATVDGSAAS